MPKFASTKPKCFDGVNMNFEEKIDKSKLPEHIAIIMDGNGRWAKAKGQPRVLGHRAGVKTVRRITEACAKIGVKYLTLYAFSTENWNRPAFEVNALMRLLVETLNKEVKVLNKNKIQLQTIGDLSALPERSRKAMEKAIEDTAANDRMRLTLALNYSGRWEITEAARTLAQKAQKGELNADDIDEDLFSAALTTHDMPDPELLIRTSGETRLSNYLLWQLAYAEFYFTPLNWPDFMEEDLHEAIYTFQNRERRFGKTSEQLK